MTYLFIAFVNSPWINLPYVSAGLFMINLLFNGMFFPASTAMIHDLVKMEQRKSVFTAMYWLGNLATALGTITGAFYFLEYQYYFFLLVGTVSLLSSLVTYLFIKESLVKRNVSDTKVASTSIWSSYYHVLKDRIYMIYLFSCFLSFRLKVI
ncbi:MFS transporter [Niallia sp. JL1B1071]|uniref:MFS transporter n=1 Tax=Niallia tiangongensis TaxID=3237105 RepID=UPI0037DD9B6D